MSDSTFKCSNCGAEIKKSDPKCPYCGYINEEGAEKEYMGRLYGLRNDLDSIDEEAASGYSRDYKKTFKLIGITLGVLILISGLIFGTIAVKKNKEKRNEPAKSDDMLKEMTWKKEAFEEFDRLYEQGEYEKLCEAVYAPYEENHDVSAWKHYWFASIYNDYLMTKQDLERIDKEGWSEYYAGNIFYRCCFCYYEELYKNSYINSLSDEEIEKLRPAIDYMNGVLHDRLGFSDEDMEGLKDTLIGKYTNLQYDRCVEIGKKHIGQFR